LDLVQGFPGFHQGPASFVGEVQPFAIGVTGLGVALAAVVTVGVTGNELALHVRSAEFKAQRMRIGNETDGYRVEVAMSHVEAGHALVCGQQQLVEIGAPTGSWGADGVRS
jgi:hypothetical protein